MSSPLSAGSIVETNCTRCRQIMNHTIVAMVGEKIVRVECNTCRGIHAFHPVKVPRQPAAAKAPTAAGRQSPPRAGKVDPAAAERAEWEALQAGIDPSQAVPYDMNRSYRTKSLLFHPNFGIGIVQLVLPPNKMDVLFQTGKKRLRCG